MADWRAEELSRIRGLISEADPDVVEEIKWRKPSNPAGVPVWSHDGMICTGETYKDKVKITFSLAQEDDAWKIADIRYAEGHALLKLYKDAAAGN